MAHDRASIVERLKMSSFSPTTCARRPVTWHSTIGADLGEDSEWAWRLARACPIPGSALGRWLGQACSQ